MTANSFEIHQCTVSKTMRTGCEELKNVPGLKYLHLIKATIEMQNKVSEFEGKFGCIDGTHISLKRPLVNSQDFFNHK